MKNLKLSRKQWILIAFVFIGMLLLFMMLSNYQRKKTELVFSNMEVEEMEAKIESTKTGISLWTKKQKDLNEAKQRYPKQDIENTVLSFLMQIEKEAKEIQIHHVTPKVNGIQSFELDLVEIPVVVEVSGQYEKVIKFMQNIVKNNPFVYEKDIQLKVQNNQELQELQELTGIIEFMLIAKNNIVGGDLEALFAQAQNKQPTQDPFGFIIDYEQRKQEEIDERQRLIEEMESSGIEPVQVNDFFEFAEAEIASEKEIPVEKERGFFPLLNPTKIYSKNMNEQNEVIGINFSIESGKEVYAIEEGHVFFVGELPEYGQCIMIRHRDQHISLYGNLKTGAIQKNQFLHKGTLIGKTKSPIFYFGYSINNYFIDPIPFMRKSMILE